MWIKILLFVLSTIVLCLVALLGINRVRLDRANAELVQELLAESNPASDAVFRAEDVQGLPQPVQRYLLKVIPEGQPYVQAVRLVQAGEFRLGDRTAPWKAMEAEQCFTVDPAGFVWDAKIEMAPLVSARVVDMFKSGKGALRAKIFSTITVADAQGPELDSGELMRYLAEATWFPTAFLPGQGIEWSPIDDHSALATIEQSGTSAAVVFYFDEQDLVESIYAPDRLREVDGRYEPTPWTGQWRNYQIRQGLLIPIEGEVAWNLPDGDLTYWQAHLDSVEYDPAP